jgi:uncharacterized metal-binding protein YceD (DUF177 family)
MRRYAANFYWANASKVDMKIESSSEFSRHIRVDQLADQDTEFAFESEPEERTQLAERFSILDLERLDVRVWARRINGTPVVRVRVNFVADVLQSCVVTLDPVAAHIDEWFEVEYVPGGDSEEGKEIVFDADDDDPPERMQGGKFDIGEAISEHLALSLDDYPRKPGAEIAEHIRHGEESEAAENPFAVLKNNHNEN